MRSLDQLWNNAQHVARRALVQADAEVNGTPRARAQFEAMDDSARDAMQAVVVSRYGQTAWDDFVRAIGGQDGKIH